MFGEIFPSIFDMLTSEPNPYNFDKVDKMLAGLSQFTVTETKSRKANL